MSTARRLRIGVLTGVPVYDVGINQYVEGVWRGICAAARQRNCDLLFACGLDLPIMQHGFHAAWPVYAPENCFVPVGPWNTDGLIAITPLEGEARSHYLREVQAGGLPVVFVGAGEEGPTVAAENAAGIRQAVEHLVDHHGHRHIAYIAGEPDGGDSVERLHAFHDALRQYGLPVDSRLVAYGYHSWQGGLQAMRQLLETAPPFTAVVASNDVSARAALQVIWEAGRRVPEELALVGFDDQLDARATHPPLTTIHHPMFEMGQQAFDWMWQVVTRQVTPPPFTRIPTRLVVRQSCGCRSKMPAPELSMLTGSEPAAQARVQLAGTMAEAVAAESSYLGHDTAQNMAGQLLASYLHSTGCRDATLFNTTLQEMLGQMEALGDDSHAWQAAISVLETNLPALLACQQLSSSSDLGDILLSQARIAISESVRRQYSAYVIQRGTDEAVSRLTARLLAVMDETQLFHIVTDDLPTVGIYHAHIALFEPEAGDPVAWSTLLDAPLTASWRRFRSTSFPPAGLYPGGEPLALAVLPLVFRDEDNILGFVTFEATRLSFYQALLAQHLAAALRATRLYQAMAEANRIKSYFLSTVSHELRTPLSLIVGMSEMLLNHQSPTPEADLERMHDSAEHLGRLLRDVLDLASSESGQLRLQAEPFDLSQALQMAVETGEQLAREKGLAWKSELPEPGPWVWGDRTRLRQVALNLISNAVKFTSQGQVSLTAWVEDGYVTVEVADTGIGIPPEEQARIFDEFRQSTRTAARGYGGLGLGLAISKRLVELHHGQMSVTSSGQEGAGSRFAFRLPVMQGEALEVLSQLEAGQRPQRVLLLGGSAAGPEPVRSYLLDHAFEVDLCLFDDTPQLLPQLQKAPPGAIVLDVYRSPEQGWQIFQALKENPLTRAIPILFYALAAEPDAGMLLEMDYVAKPVGALELAEAIERQAVLAETAMSARTVLIVDDEPGILEMHSRMVEGLLPGCRVLQAPSGRAALEAVRQQPVDLVLLDLMMPEMDGFEVLEVLRSQEVTRGIPVIVLTARTLSEQDMARLSRGVTSVLSKGVFTVDETLGHIEAALQRSRRQGSEAQRLVRRAMAYIHAHYAEDLTREAIAQYVNVNPIYLTRCFQQELSMPPMTYLTRHRMHRAKILLAEGRLSITAVALAVGYTDTAYFGRVFRKETGLTPSAYQRGQHIA